jgi:hypothetical protein
MSNFYVFPFIPVRKLPNPPGDLENPEIELCSHCNEQIWVGKKKKRMFDELDKTQDHYYGCYDCFLKIYNIDYEKLVKVNI